MPFATRIHSIQPTQSPFAFMHSFDPSLDSSIMFSTNYLRSSLADLSKAQLCDLVVKLATEDAIFHHAISNELHLRETASYASESDDSLPNTPTTFTTPYPTHGRRQKSRRCGTKTGSASFGISSDSEKEEKYWYHPGQLESEEFEFLSLSPEGRTERVVRLISMWSCCAGEDHSTGCVVAPARAMQKESKESYRRRTRNRSTRKRRAPSSSALRGNVETQL